MSENIEDSIRSWLIEQGYPLEMRVAQIFVKAGFSVIQSAYYSSPDAETQREIDVIAYRDMRCGDCLLRVEFVVECKSSKKRPWLLFAGQQKGLADPARVIQRITTSRGYALLERLCQMSEVQQLSLFTLLQPIAYSATEALTSGKDVVYAATSAVGNAASGLASELDASPHQKNSIIKILFPVVVVEGLLFSCTLDDTAAVQISQLSGGTLLWRNRLSRMPHTIIHILTESHLAQFANDMRRSIDQFFLLVEPVLQSVFSLPPD